MLVEEGGEMWVGNQDHQGPPKNTSTGISPLDFCYGTCWNVAEGRVTWGNNNIYSMVMPGSQFIELR